MIIGLFSTVMNCLGKSWCVLVPVPPAVNIAIIDIFLPFNYIKINSLNTQQYLIVVKPYDLVSNHIHALTNGHHNMLDIWNKKS